MTLFWNAVWWIHICCKLLYNVDKARNKFFIKIDPYAESYLPIIKTNFLQNKIVNSIIGVVCQISTSVSATHRTVQSIRTASIASGRSAANAGKAIGARRHLAANLSVSVTFSFKAQRKKEILVSGRNWNSRFRHSLSRIFGDMSNYS